LSSTAQYIRFSYFQIGLDNAFTIF
jgi:hypothetical protein